MSTAKRSRASRLGWGILLVLTGILGLNGVGLYLFVDTHVERTIGVLLMAFGALALTVALDGFRHGTRWAWQTTWLVPISLAAIGLHSLRGDRADVPAFYLGLTAVALAGQLLARERHTP